MHLFTETCKKPLQHSILLWAFECNERPFQRAPGSHFICSQPIFPIQLLQLPEILERWSRISSETPQLCGNLHTSWCLSTVSWWHCGHSSCAVWFQGRRFPLPLTMLVGLGIHFHSCSCCLVPLERMIWHFFQIPLLSAPGPALLCAWGCDICARASSASSTLPAVFCIAWKQGVQSAAQRVWDTHTHIHVQTQHKSWFWEAWDNTCT